MRTISKIIVHCSATPESRDVSAAEITRWHKEKGYQTIGYHYVIRLDGSIERGRAEEAVGAHCVGQNQTSIGVCLIGGLALDGKTAKDTRTPAQTASLIRLLKELKDRYQTATVHGHNEFAQKACPSFDVQKWLKTVQL